jgi:hypothetical protein
MPHAIPPKRPTRITSSNAAPITNEAAAQHIRVPVGELLTLQVWNPQQTTMTVYFSNWDVATGLSAYTSCADGVCPHSGHDLNAIVYGWSRPS